MCIVRIYMDIIPRIGLPFSACKIAIKNKIQFDTNCINFFSFDTLLFGEYDDVIAIFGDNESFISAKMLLEKHGYPHTNKAIRRAHSISKILMCDGFNSMPMASYENYIQELQNDTI